LEEKKNPLAAEEGTAEHDGGDEPGCGAADSGAAEAEPLFHDVDFVEELAARDFDGERGEQEDSSVDPEDRGYGERVPVGDDVVSGRDVHRALAHEERADEHGEEDEVGREDGEDGHPIADELLAGAVTARMAGVPVLVASAAARRSAIHRWLAAEAGVFAFGFDRVAGKGGGHGALRVEF
jgi:hypothetical protein